RDLRIIPSTAAEPICAAAIDRLSVKKQITKKKRAPQSGRPFVIRFSSS
ncbi:MAG: hypothetical protein ACI9G1_004278, partial [Pirellulaceae bacterium]